MLESNVFINELIGQQKGAGFPWQFTRNVMESPHSQKKMLQFGRLSWHIITKLLSVAVNGMSSKAASFALQFCQLISPFSSKPKAVGSKSHYSTEFVFPMVCIDQGHFLVKNSVSSFAVSTQEMAVAFPAHKVMHFDRRRRASPSDQAAQTTARCSPEARCYSCCLITFSRPGAACHSEYQKGRKAVLRILWQSSARSSIQNRLVI